MGVINTFQDDETYQSTESKTLPMKYVLAYHHKAQDPLPYGDGEFDLVISAGLSITCDQFELQTALQEMQRVGRKDYLMLKAIAMNRNCSTCKCWALTAESFFDVSEWIWLYRHFGYNGL